MANVVISDINHSITEKEFRCERKEINDFSVENKKRRRRQKTLAGKFHNRNDIRNCIDVELEIVKNRRK